MSGYLDSIAQLISEPTANLTAAAIGFAIIVLVLLIVILVLLLVALWPARRAKKIPVEHAPKKNTSRVKRDPRTWILLWVGGGLLVLIALLVSTSSNQYCADVCHSMAPAAESWESGSHASVTCVRCHETSPGAGALTSMSTRVNDVVVSVVPNTAFEHPKVSSDTCLDCHENILTETLATDRGIRVAHEHFIAEGAPCEACHSNVGHTGKRSDSVLGSTMSACLRCHDDDIASAECATCHTDDPGMTPIVERRPVRVDMPSPTCGGCHQQQTCDTCHGIRMPHPDDFADPHQHARLAAFDSGKRLCYGCHTTNDCSNCHLPFDAHGTDWAVRHKSYSFADGNGYCLWCHKTPDYCRVCH